MKVKLGKRGCGKTVFLSVLAQRGSTRRENVLTKNSVAIAAVYFFTRFQQFNVSVEKMLWSIADQLVKTIDGFAEKLTEMNLDRFELRKLDPQALFLKVIAEPLEKIKSKTRYVIVIDAVNEVNDKYRESIIRIVRALFIEHTPEWLGLLISASAGTYVLKRLRTAVVSSSSFPNFHANPKVLRELK